MQRRDNMTSFENNHDSHRICKTNVIIKIIMIIVMVIVILMKIMIKSITMVTMKMIKITT